MTIRPQKSHFGHIIGSGAVFLQGLSIWIEKLPLRRITTTTNTIFTPRKNSGCGIDSLTNMLCQKLLTEEEGGVQSNCRIHSKQAAIPNIYMCV